MDLYSSDVSGIQEGNMRSAAIEASNRAVDAHNKDLGGQIAGLKQQQKTADVLTQTKDVTQQFWAGGKLPSSVNAWKSWSSGETDFRGNPTTTAQTKLSDTAEAVAAGEKEDLGIKDTGDGIFESDTGGAQSALSEGEDMSKGLGKFAGIAAKGAGAVTALGIGGYDIYQDFSGGKGFHIAGDNWASKASNVLQIGGAIADVGGTVFPPLALIGGVADIVGGVAGEIGSELDSSKEATQDKNLQESETQSAVGEGVSSQVTGRVS